MLYRRREDEMIHVTVVGIGDYGMEVGCEFDKRFLECQASVEKGALKIITNKNEISVICNIEIAYLIGKLEDRMIPWNDKNIESEEKTRNLLITVSDPEELSVKMFHSASVSLLGKPECKRIAFLKKNDAVTENNLLSQQLDHIISCDDINSTVGMLMLLIRMLYINDFDLSTFERNEFRHMFGGCDGKVVMSYKERLISQCTSDSSYIDEIYNLVDKVTNASKKSIDVTKRYSALIYIEGLWDLNWMGLFMQRFREILGPIQIEDERLLFTKTIEYDRKTRNACMVFLMEISD